jgi:hypothetical protein
VGRGTTAKSIDQQIKSVMVKKVVGRTTEIHKSVLAVSYDEASRTGLFYRKSGTGKATGAICDFPGVSRALGFGYVCRAAHGGWERGESRLVWRSALAYRPVHPCPH